MLQGEHTAIPLTFIKLPFVMKILFLRGLFITQVLLYIVGLDLGANFCKDVSSKQFTGIPLSFLAGFFEEKIGLLN